MAEYVKDRARADPKVRKLVEEVRLFDGLLDHAGWRRLRDSIKEQETRFMHSLAKRLMSGEVADQRDIDFQRGFLEGARTVILKPEKALKGLEVAASAAYAASKLELLSEQEGESPYL